MKALRVGTGVLAVTLSGGAVLAQQQPPAGGDYVTREEYDRLKNQMEGLRQELDTIKKEGLVRQTQLNAKEIQAQQADRDQIIAQIQKDVEENRSLLSGLRPGTTKLVIAGDASASFSAVQGSPSTFGATFSPLMLWQFNDRLLFEGALDFSVDRNDVGENETATDLTIANINYIINDYVSVGGGLFVVPFGAFHLHFDPPWINKLPDEPLVFGDNGIAPSSELGAYVTGGVPIGKTRLTYALYATNGPSLITDDPAAAGSLDFDNFTDLNNDKAIGGRVSFLPIPELEVGYSIMRASVDPDGFDKNVNAVLQAGDVNYVKEIEAIQGTITLRAEWVWSNVENVTYHPTGSGSLRFDNNRNGGYGLVAYRPTLVSNRFLKNVEFVFRYDRLEVSRNAPGGDIEQRYAFGVNYWLASNAVLKFAYEVDDREVETDTNAFLMQFGLGL